MRYLIKSHKTLLSVTSINSSSHSGIFCSIAETQFSSSIKLELNFQYEGPRLGSSRLLKDIIIAEWSVLMAVLMLVSSTSS